MITQKKIIILPIILTILVAGVAVFQSNATFAATAKKQPTRVVGMARFILKGTVVTTSANTVTVRIKNTSKNAKLFDNKDETIKISSKTIFTKNGKHISLNQIKLGDTIKVFGIFNKKTGVIILVNWIKVLPK